MSLPFDLQLAELQLPMERGKDGEEEGGEGEWQWPGAPALRVWPHSEPQGSGHTLLSTHSSLAAVSHLSLVTSDICPAGHT